MERDEPNYNVMEVEKVEVRRSQRRRSVQDFRAMREEEQSGNRSKSKKRGQKKGFSHEDKQKSSKKEKNINVLESLLGWRNKVQIPPSPQGSYQIYKVKKICQKDLSQYAQKVQGIFINIKWDCKLKNQKVQGVSVQQFKKMNLQNQNLINDGIVFIWVEKTLLKEIIEIMDEKGFRYIENLQIVYLDLNKVKIEFEKQTEMSFEIQKVEESSIKQEKEEKPRSQSRGPRASSISKIATINSKEFLERQLHQKDFILKNIDKLAHVNPNTLFFDEQSTKAKAKLMLFRKCVKSKISRNVGRSRSGSKNQKNQKYKGESKSKSQKCYKNPNQKALSLGHQRNPDVLFDISSRVGLIDVKTKNHIYHIIQTLLPRAVRDPEEEEGFKLMELWGDEEAPRRGWVTVVEE